ncbi:MAG TPA: hypothetical protein VFQ17_06790 [Nocardioides sp.]|jgi:hypothetical protein|nr:hypothetical protein [Nocardioides sp.]
MNARPAATGAPGEPLAVAGDLDRANLFDAGTGQMLAEVGR